MQMCSGIASTQSTECWLLVSVWPFVGVPTVRQTEANYLLASVGLFLANQQKTKKRQTRGTPVCLSLGTSWLAKRRPNRGQQRGSFRLPLFGFLLGFLNCRKAKLYPKRSKRTSGRTWINGFFCYARQKLRLLSNVAFLFTKRIYQKCPKTSSMFYRD